MSAWGTSRKSEKNAPTRTLGKDGPLIGFDTATSFSLPGGSGGVSAVISVELTTVTPFAGMPPIQAPAIAEKPLPVMVTAVPPAEGPEVGAMPVTGAGTPVLSTKTTPVPPDPPCRVVPNRLPEASAMSAA